MRISENNKSPGEDIVSAELIKYGGKKLWEEIRTLFEVIRASKNARELENCNYTPINKKGDKMLCSTRRGISLLNVCYKVFTNILRRWLVPYAEEILGNNQCGFTKGDQLLIFIYVKKYS